MSEESNITKVFADFQKHMDEEQNTRERIRELIREIEQTAREILAELQSVHHPDGLKSVSAICEKCLPMFEVARQNIQVLGCQIPENMYYRFNDQWKFMIQRMTFLAAFLTYLQTEALATREKVAGIIGVEVDREKGFHLDLDDYLTGILQLASELSRLAVNSVTAGDYGRPVRIAKFIAELDSGFRLLNLKNDSLRKRFDGLKYDLKKVEEVVYDLTIRNLKPAE